MKKIIYVCSILFIVTILSGCDTQTATCGVGTLIQNGQCVADPDYNLNNNQTPPTGDVSCDSVQGDVFYEIDFDTLDGNIVSNESGQTHNSTNFVIWGKDEGDIPFASYAIVDNELTIPNLDGDQLDQWHQYGLGYQFFNFVTGNTYTVCAIVEGTQGQEITSELGIYYGHGTKDEIILTGEQQLIVQDYTALAATNNDYGQYVMFFGNMTGELIIHKIKIIETINN